MIQLVNLDALDRIIVFLKMIISLHKSYQSLVTSILKRSYPLTMFLGRSPAGPDRLLAIVPTHPITVPNIPHIICAKNIQKMISISLNILSLAGQFIGLSAFGIHFLPI